MESFEEKEEGTLSFKTYLSYIKQTHWCVSLSLCLLFLLPSALHVFIKLYLVSWIHKPPTHQREPLYLQVFSGATLLLLALSFFTAYLLALFVLSLSNKLHSHMLPAVTSAPASFFWRNPLGRIINRFAKDQAVLDNTLPYQVVTFAIVSTPLTLASLLRHHSHFNDRCRLPCPSAGGCSRLPPYAVAQEDRSHCHSRLSSSRRTHSFPNQLPFRLFSREPLFDSSLPPETLLREEVLRSCGSQCFSLLYLLRDSALAHHPRRPRKPPLYYHFPWNGLLSQNGRGRWDSLGSLSDQCSLLDGSILAHGKEKH